MFYSKTKPRARRTNALTIKEKPVYTEKIIAGQKTLVNTGEKKNTYKLTQSHAEELKIDNIIRRAALGDVRGLREPVKAEYIDLTTMPKTYAEALQSIIHLEQAFESLPIETKREYNFSKEAFISDFGSERFARAVGIEPKVEIEVPGAVQVTQSKEEFVNE